MQTLPNEAPTASFLAVKQPWVFQAACAGRWHIFTPDVLNAETIAECRVYCEHCPVRIECGERAMEEEGTSSERFFVRAYMTPEQRTSIHRRGGLQGRDPMRLVQGFDEDPAEVARARKLKQAIPTRIVPPIPDEGDRWSKHHTTLARKLVRCLVDLNLGQRLPSVTALCAQLECTRSLLTRVLDELVKDETLEHFDGHYLYNSDARVLSSWLPPHLRGQAASTEPTTEETS